MTQRGLTLIELLVSVALLGMLSVALTSWVQLSSRASADAQVTLPWERAAHAVLERINQDLLAGDLTTYKKDEPRVRVVDGGLTILTRGDGIGPCQNTYAREAFATELSLVQRSSGSDQSRTRRLVGEVAGFDCEVDAVAQTLTVALTSTSGQRAERSYTWER